jgi:hypothetical protein
MRRVLAVLGLVLLVGFVGTAECISEVEDNGTPELADGLGALPGAGCRTGVVDPASDVDFYWFQVQSTCTVSIGIGSWEAILFTLHDAGGEWIDGESHTGGAEPTRLVARLDPGMYYVRLEGAFGSATGRYEISVSAASTTAGSACLDEVEANGAFAYADALRPRSDVSCRRGAISPADDVDVYWFEIGSSVTVMLETVTSGDTVLYLYDGSGAAVAEDDDGGEGSASRLIVSLSSGRYFVEVVSYGRDQRIPEYEIHLTIEGQAGDSDPGDDGPPPDGQDGSTPGDPPPWGWWITGSGILLNAWGSIDKECASDYDFIHGLCDVKSFSVTVPSEGYIAVALIDEPGQWLKAEVLDAFGYHIVGREGPQSSVYSQWAWVPAGTYRVEVTPGKRLDRSGFELHVFYSRSEPDDGFLVQRYGPKERTL